MRVYLAGPKVFLEDPVSFGVEKRALCARFGLVGVFPLDAGLDLGERSGKSAGLAISRANEELIRSCDLLIANMTPFRSPSMDVGTAFEMGFMRALDRPVFGYSATSEPYLERVRAFSGGTMKQDCNGRFLDADGKTVENFGMADNLMMIGALAEAGADLVLGTSGRIDDLAPFEKCLEIVAQQLGIATNYPPPR